MGQFKDLTGERFGRLVVTGRAGSMPDGRSTWYCDCDCGNTRVVKVGKQMKLGIAKSCGCLQDEHRELMTKHGHSRKVFYKQGGTKTYRTWKGMIRRCHNPNDKSYGRYGGKGIQVCERWRHSFENFLEDMGEAPEGKSIERKDFTKGYSPDNCTWATVAEQNRNKCTNRKVTFNGETLCINDWATRTGLKRETIKNRLNRGWSVEDALTRPPDQRFRMPK